MIPLLLLSLLPAAGAGVGTPLPPRQDLCSIERETAPGSWETVCSATLLRNGVLVSAAHCFYYTPTFLADGEFRASCPASVKISFRAVRMDPAYEELQRLTDVLRADASALMTAEFLARGYTDPDAIPVEVIDAVRDEVWDRPEIAERNADLAYSRRRHDVALVVFPPRPELRGANELLLPKDEAEITALSAAGACVMGGYGHNVENPLGAPRVEGVTVGVQTTFAVPKDSYFGEQGRMFGIPSLPGPTAYLQEADSGGGLLCTRPDGKTLLAGVISSGNSAHTLTLATALGDTPIGRWVAESLKR